MTGMFNCDLFIRTFNPTGMRLPPVAWSPDLGRARRMPATGN